MNTLKKTLALVAALTMTTGVFVGCDKDDESKSGDTTTKAGDTTTKAPDETKEPEKVELKTDGKELITWGWNAEFVTTMMENYYLREKTLPSGVEYKPHNQGSSDTYQKDLDAAINAGEKIDLFVIEAGYAPAYINSPWTVPLSTIGITDEELKAQQYGYTLDIVTATEGDDVGKIKGSSWQAAPGGFCYRADLAESLLNVKTPDEMQAKISDWTKFQETAKELKTKSNGKTKICTTIEGIWQTFSSTRSTAWVEDGALVISDEVKTFMNLAKAMKTENYYLGTGQWNDAWYAAGQTDDTMGYFVSTWGVGDAIMMKACGGDKGKTYGKWAFCEGPQAYYWGGTWIVVAPTCDNQDIAADIIRYFTVNADSMKSYAQGKDLDGDGKTDNKDKDLAPANDYMNNKALMKEISEGAPSNNLFKGGETPYKFFYKAADQIKTLHITGYDQDINKSFQVAYADYADGKKSYDEAIAQFKKDVKTKFASLKGTD